MAKIIVSACLIGLATRYKGDACPCERLIDKVRLHHGDLCLLWHNSNLTPDTYHRSLYPKILRLI